MPKTDQIKPYEIVLLPGHAMEATSAPLNTPEVWMPFFDGYQGPNRSDAYCQIEARNDLEAVLYWVRKTGGRSEATKTSYIKEANHFVAWAAIERGKRLSDITSSDLHYYQRFLGSPEPAAIWIGKRGRRAADAGAWRPPFAGPLQRNSIATAMRTLLSLFEFLHASGYLRGNPFVAITIDSGKKVQNKIVRRNLQEAEWELIKATLQESPRNTDREKAIYHRKRWVILLLYLTGLRRSEIGSSRMNDFMCVDGGCVLRVVGKGSKERDIPVTVRLSQELAIYRESMGMKPWPDANDSAPLVERINEYDEESESHASISTIGKIVKDVFESAALKCSKSDPEMAEHLKEMSAHWLRHTFATELLKNGEDMKATQDILGHSDLNTTMGYSHQDENHRIAITEKAFAGMILFGDEI